MQLKEVFAREKARAAAAGGNGSKDFEKLFNWDNSSGPGVAWGLHHLVMDLRDTGLEASLTPIIKDGDYRIKRHDAFYGATTFYDFEVQLYSDWEKTKLLGTATLSLVVGALPSAVVGDTRGELCFEGDRAELALALVKQAACNAAQAERVNDYIAASSSQTKQSRAASWLIPA